MKDPERPAFLQLLREHEIGGRSVDESLGLITGRSMQGAHSIAAVLHGRLEKAAPPARGQTQTFAERVPGGAAPEIAEAYQAADARQAEIGRELAERPRGMGAEGVGRPSGRGRGAAGRLAAAGRAGGRLPRGGRDHRPERGDRARAGRQGRPAGDVQRQRPRPGAARRAGADGRDGQRGPRGPPRRAGARRGGRACRRQRAPGLRRASAGRGRRSRPNGRRGRRPAPGRSAEALARSTTGSSPACGSPTPLTANGPRRTPAWRPRRWRPSASSRARPRGAHPGHGRRGGRGLGGTARDAADRPGRGRG